MHELIRMPCFPVTLSLDGVEPFPKLLSMILYLHWASNQFVKNLFTWVEIQDTRVVLGKLYWLNFLVANTV